MKINVQPEEYISKHDIINLNFEQYESLKSNIIKNRSCLEMLKHCVRDIKYKLILISDSNISYINKDSVKCYSIKDKISDNTEHMDIYPLIRFDSLNKKNSEQLNHEIKLFTGKLKFIFKDNNNKLIQKIKNQEFSSPKITKYITDSVKKTEKYIYYMSNLENLKTSLSSELKSEYLKNENKLNQEYLNFLISFNTKLLNIFETISKFIENYV